jgi:hypothetical protein
VTVRKASPVDHGFLAAPRDGHQTGRWKWEESLERVVGSTRICRGDPGPMSFRRGSDAICGLSAKPDRTCRPAGYRSTKEPQGSIIPCTNRLRSSTSSQDGRRKEDTGPHRPPPCSSWASMVRYLHSRTRSGASSRFQGAQ